MKDSHNYVHEDTILRKATAKDNAHVLHLLELECCATGLSNHSGAIAGCRSMFKSIISIGYPIVSY
jgi:hypothetical protein